MKLIWLLRKSICWIEDKSEKKSLLIERNCVRVMLMNWKGRKTFLTQLIDNELHNSLQGCPALAFSPEACGRGCRRCEALSVLENVSGDSRWSHDGCDCKLRRFRSFPTLLCCWFEQFTMLRFKTKYFLSLWIVFVIFQSFVAVQKLTWLESDAFWQRNHLASRFIKLSQLITKLGQVLSAVE